ncbi:DNA polymerase III subunit alpha [Granulicoccus sp. GXG6511]|uniref:DNA polymerase III subunit alpha n=1 Tax=Granulicoccus sp. GXG6511 TaxID=3381351 RepID=UPI003D7E0896
MTDPFVHLRVASGYSLRFGAAQPAMLVERAAGHGMDTLALTDRDGLYGAIRFAKACDRAGIAPVLGVDLAVLPESAEILPVDRPRHKPVRGGEIRDPGLPRVVVLATSRAGWASLCRLVSEMHLAGARGRPVATVDLIARFAAAGELVVLLGADSELGAAVHLRRDLAEATLQSWRARFPLDSVVVAVTDHRVPGDGPGSGVHAARMLALADATNTTTVLTNAVRMADRSQAPTVDVLDCARRLVPLSGRNVDRRNAEGWLKSGKEMLEIADRLAQRGGRGPHGAEWLLGDTRRLALRCRLDPRQDLGLGEIHLPELELLDGGRGVSDAQTLLAQRCEAGLAHRYGPADLATRDRLDDELAVIRHLGFASYFLTVADVVGMVRAMGCRVAARGSGAGSLVNYLLGVSGVDPIRHGLIMERFLSPLRRALPDIDLDVESHRREEIYQVILDTFGGERVACVAMLETYRVRHAVRDAGAALSLPPGEIDAIAKAFPHIRARDARAALRDLPELRAAGLAERRLDLLFELVESLDGLPRHIALHPCGVLLSDATLLDRTPVEASFAGFPMSQFDKDDVEDIGLLKLDVLGIRMQSSMSHAVAEIERTVGERIDLEALAVDGFADPATYELIGEARTLGCFQIESPGQRELIGKFGPSDFTDIIIDISLFRPGPVKSDMVRPFLNARQGWDVPRYLHSDLEPVLRETCGVVVFHEQVIRIISILTGCTLAEGDEARRALGDREAKADVQAWFYPAVRKRGYAEPVVESAWKVLEAFASFGFCKAHAAAFALPTYQSAWLKTHWPAHFFAGVLTHDPGMYPKRLILDEARRSGIDVLGLDVNLSHEAYRVEPVAASGAGWGIRLALADVKGISGAELARIIAGQPYRSIADFWNRATVSTPVVERLVLAGAFDQLHRIRPADAVQRRDQLTRRDLLLAITDLDRDSRAAERAIRARGRGLLRPGPRPSQADERAAHLAAQSADPRDRAKAQSRRPAEVRPQESQLPLDFDAGDEIVPSGLPEMTDTERVRAELDVLGMDASRHVVDFYRPLLDALEVTWSKDLLQVRHRENVLVAGVKVATQTPPVRSGRRVVFLTLDDTTGPVDATFFEEAQGPYAKTLFDSWLLIVHGDLRRTGPRGVSLLAHACWDLGMLFETWRRELELTGDPARALAVVRDLMAEGPEGFGGGGRRMLVHPSGFRQSAYADVVPAGTPAASAPRKLWHSSPGSSGR